MVLWLWKTNSHNHINGSKGHILGIAGLLRTRQDICIKARPLVIQHLSSGEGWVVQNKGERLRNLFNRIVWMKYSLTPIKQVWWLDSTTGYNTTVLCVFCWSPTGIPPTMFEMMYSWVPICHMAYRRQRVRPAATKSMKGFFWAVGGWLLRWPCAPHRSATTVTFPGSNIGLCIRSPGRVSSCSPDTACCKLWVKELSASRCLERDLESVKFRCQAFTSRSWSRSGISSSFLLTSK